VRRKEPEFYPASSKAATQQRIANVYVDKVFYTRNLDNDYISIYGINKAEIHQIRSV